VAPPKPATTTSKPKAVESKSAKPVVSATEKSQTR
jgi:hypothetical protein